MNTRSLEKIRAAAQFIGTHKEAVQLSRQHLAEPVQLAIAILDRLLASPQQTAPEIAEKLLISSETVRQVLRSLVWNPIDGGIIMQVSLGNGKNSAGYSLPQGKIVWQKPTTLITHSGIKRHENN